jgi:hypothetical protein
MAGGKTIVLLLLLIRDTVVRIRHVTLPVHLLIFHHRADILRQRTTTAWDASPFGCSAEPALKRVETLGRWTKMVAVQGSRRFRLECLHAAAPQAQVGHVHAAAQKVLCAWAVVYAG